MADQDQRPSPDAAMLGPAPSGQDSTATLPPDLHADARSPLDRDAARATGNAMPGVLPDPSDLAANRRYQNQAVQGEIQELGQERQSYKDYVAKYPNPPDVKPFEGKRQYANPWDAFSSPAGAILMVASALTKAPLTSAMAGFSGLMKGMNERNDKQFSDSYEQWKQNSDLAFKQSEWEVNKYKNALDVMAKDFSAGQAMWGLAAAQSGNNAAAALDDPMKQQQLVGLMERNRNAAMDGAEKVDQLAQRHAAVQSYLSANVPNVNQMNPQQRQAAEYAAGVQIDRENMAKDAGAKAAAEMMAKLRPAGTEILSDGDLATMGERGARSYLQQQESSGSVSARTGTHMGLYQMDTGHLGMLGMYSPSTGLIHTSQGDFTPAQFTDPKDPKARAAQEEAMDREERIVDGIMQDPEVHALIGQPIAGDPDKKLNYGAVLAYIHHHAGSALTDAPTARRALVKNLSDITSSNVSDNMRNMGDGNLGTINYMKAAASAYDKAQAVGRAQNEEKQSINDEASSRYGGKETAAQAHERVVQEGMDAPYNLPLPEAAARADQILGKGGPGKSGKSTKFDQQVQAGVEWEQAHPAPPKQTAAEAETREAQKRIDLADRQTITLPTPERDILDTQVSSAAIGKPLTRAEARTVNNQTKNMTGARYGKDLQDIAKLRDSVARAAALEHKINPNDPNSIKMVAGLFAPLGIGLDQLGAPFGKEPKVLEALNELQFTKSDLLQESGATGRLAAPVSALMSALRPNQPPGALDKALEHVIDSLTREYETQYVIMNRGYGDQGFTADAKALKLTNPFKPDTPKAKAAAPGENVVSKGVAQGKPFRLVVDPATGNITAVVEPAAK